MPNTLHINKLSLFLIFFKILLLIILILKCKHHILPILFICELSKFYREWLCFYEFYYQETWPLICPRGHRKSLLFSWHQVIPIKRGLIFFSTQAYMGPIVPDTYMDVVKDITSLSTSVRDNYHNASVYVDNMEYQWITEALWYLSLNTLIFLLYSVSYHDSYINPVKFTEQQQKDFEKIYCFMVFNSPGELH